MRLWHYELIPYLPNKQLLAQWRELNSIFKNQPKHILINYVYEYPKMDLYEYTNLVLREIYKRKIIPKANMAMKEYFKNILASGYESNYNYSPFAKHHNYRYFIQCFMNLQEKYDRGQKDFDEKLYNKLENFITIKAIKSPEFIERMEQVKAYKLAIIALDKINEIYKEAEKETN